MKDTNDDDELKPKQSSDNTDKLSARKLLHSKFLGMDTDNIQREKEPPDKTDKDNVGTRYRLTMKAMRGTRLNRPPKPEEEEEWNFEGENWNRSSSGGWDEPTTNRDDNVEFCQDYQDYAAHTAVTLRRCATTKDTTTAQPDTYLMIQSDHGANANITDNIAALEEIHYIEPTGVASAEKGSNLTVTAIGKLPLRTADGSIYRILCYYSKDADGTLLSPNAVCAQFRSRFYGYHIYSNMDGKLGEVVLLGREGIDDLVMTTYKENNLWWHTPDHHPLCRPLANDEVTDGDLRVNKLSNAAKWELWHQRLGHCGTRVLETIHKHVDGVPKLQGNAFYKCPSCMSGKLCTKQPTHRKGNLGTVISSDPADIAKDAGTDEVQTNVELDAWLDELHLPDAEPGQHFHADFGFVRGSEFKLELDSGKTITSVDGKNSYLLIADRATRMIWTYCSNSKAAPVKEVQAILSKFKSANPHRTIRTDQDKALGKSVEFNKMIVDEGFVMEPTGTDNSKQNSRAERPHRDLSQMMRCMLHAAGLGPEYWSHALTQAVYIKNRIPHTALNSTPYQAFTGRRPDLSDMRIFGSRVFARKPGKPKAKLDHHTSKGVFLSFTATSGNVNFIDDASGLIMTGTHVMFDEAHMTVPAAKAPLAAQALQRLGYYTRETWIDEEILQEHHADRNRDILIEKTTATAVTPTRSTSESIGIDIHSDMDDLVIPPGELKVILTGIAAKAPSGTYLRIAPRSGLTVRSNLHTMAGVVDPDYTGTIGVVLHNFGTVEQKISRGDRIAQIIPEKADLPGIKLVSSLKPTKRGSDGFGSTEMKEALQPQSMKKSDAPPTPIVPPPISVGDQRQHAAAAAKAVLEFDFDLPVREMEEATAAAAKAVLEVEAVMLNKIESDLQVYFDMPYDIEFSASPFDNYTSREMSTWGTHSTLGMNLTMCSDTGLPQLKDIQKSTPAARVKKWKSQLRGAYITAINGINVSTIDEIKDAIQKHRTIGEESDIEIQFATIDRQAMQPQMGIPQVYQDQMNIIGQHLWEIQNDPDWSERVNNAMPAMEALNRNDTVFTKNDKAQMHHAGMQINSVKVTGKKLTRKRLKAQKDWHEWQASEWKQLDAYRDQDMFDNPEPRPRGVNLLNMLWCYLVKDDGRKKARCVCNGSKRMQGTVTLAETYAASLDQTASRVFWAATAINNFVTVGADAANAFAEAPPPVAPLYVYVDEQYREWHRERNPGEKPIPHGYVMRAKRALQGHPESPRLWAKLVDRIIRKLQLKPCTHEPNLYYTSNYKGTTEKKVLLLRQVDDFAISCQDEKLCEEVIADIQSEMTIAINKLGRLTRFNGVDIEQTRHYVKLFNRTYIAKILRNHKWLDSEMPTSVFPTPMSSDSKYQRELETAKPLSDTERGKLEKALGFTYRQGIGEILYALVTCRPDISFATIKLSQFSTKPAAMHFEALKDVFRFLKATMDEGIYYWRTMPRHDLPIGKMPECKSDLNYDEQTVTTRHQYDADILKAAVDSDFAGDTSHRKSVSGIIIKLAGGAVLYKTQYQPTIAGSSTEAEFTAATEAGKYILHLRTILQEIGLLQEDATVLFEDNQGALLMANAQRPTKRTRHMDIKHFIIQDWVAEDLLCLHRIPTADNFSDAMTKAQGGTLFYRHMNYIMGKVVPEYAKALIHPSIKRLCVDMMFDNIKSREGIMQGSLIPIR